MILRDNKRCFVCGPLNEAGLRVDFAIDRQAKAIEATFVPPDIYQGFEQIVHGGILSALLDEAMAKLTFAIGIPAVTAEMTIKFKKAAAPGDQLIVTGRIIKETRRIIEAEAVIHRGPVVIAEAAGKLLRIG